MLVGVPVWVFFNRQVLLNKKDQNGKLFSPPNASKENYKVIKKSHLEMAWAWKLKNCSERSFDLKTRQLLLSPSLWSWWFCEFCPFLFFISKMTALDG